MRCVKCTAMRHTGLLRLLCWKPSAAAVVLLYLVSVGDATYERTCTTEDRQRPNGICGQHLTAMIATLCNNDYNKRNPAYGSGVTSVVTFATRLIKMYLHVTVVRFQAE